MKIKAILLFVILLNAVVIDLSAQKLNTKRLIALGDEHFESHQFSKAAQYYKQALKEDRQNTRINFHLAESYRLGYDYKNAELYYNKVKNLDSDEFPLNGFYLALTQKLNDKYGEAMNGFDEFLSAADNYSEKDIPDKSFFVEHAKLEKEGCLLATSKPALPLKESEFINLKSPVNSSSNDYAPFIYLHDSSIVFTSGRSEAKGRLTDNRLGDSFSDQFRYEQTGQSWSKMETKDNFNVTNTQYNEGAGVFNKARNKYYFTRCEGPHCEIYVASRVNDKWEEATKLNNSINQKDSESKQPFISITGDTLFFVSNRKGGIGMNDIWMSTSSGGDNWRTPTNLGNKINTRFNETSPFYYYKKNMFFFGSAGYPGYGGIDIFMINNYSSGGKEIENVGKPFNSHLDDLYMVMGENIGYLSSNRKGGIGKFDIYKFIIPPSFDFHELQQLAEKALQSEELDEEDLSEVVIRNKDGSVKFSGTAEQLAAYYSQMNLLAAEDGATIILKRPDGSIKFSGTATELGAYYTKAGLIDEDDSSSILIKDGNGNIVFSGTAKELAAYYSQNNRLAEDDSAIIIIKDISGKVLFSGTALELAAYYSASSLLAVDDPTELVIKNRDGSIRFSGNAEEMAAYYSQSELLIEYDDAIVIIRDINGAIIFSGNTRELGAYYSDTGLLSVDDDSQVILRNDDGSIKFSGSAKELMAYYSEADMLAEEDDGLIIIKDKEGRIVFSGSAQELGAYYSKSKLLDVEDPSEIIIKDRDGNIKFKGSPEELNAYYSASGLLTVADESQVILRNDDGSIKFSGSAKELMAYYSEADMLVEEDDALIIIKDKEGRIVFSGSAQELGAYYSKSKLLDVEDPSEIIIKDRDGNIKFKGSPEELANYYSSLALLDVEDDSGDVAIRKKVTGPTLTFDQFGPSTYYKDYLKFESDTNLRDQLVLKVQIGAYEFPKPGMFTDINSLVKVKEEVVGKLTKYLIGSFNSLIQADLVRNFVVEQGVSDAFVAVYYRGERITIITYQ